jgi:DNA-directed RNA polymerase subunit RPC12/RpoP
MSARIAVECLRCRHTAVLSDDKLESHGFSRDSSLVLITRRLVCQECGSRSIKAVRTGPDEDATLVPRD